MKYIVVFFLGFAFLFVIFSSHAFAAGALPKGCSSFCDPDVPGYCVVGGKCQLQNPAPDQLVKITDIGTLLAQFIQTLLFFAGGVATFFLIIGGYRYVTSSGNEEAMEKAKKTVTSAVIGIVIIVMSFAIVLLVNNFLTKDALNNVSVLGWHRVS